MVQRCCKAKKVCGSWFLGYQRNGFGTANIVRLHYKKSWRACQKNCIMLKHFLLYHILVGFVGITFAFSHLFVVEEAFLALTGRFPAFQSDSPSVLAITCLSAWWAMHWNVQGHKCSQYVVKTFSNRATKARLPLPALQILEYSADI